QPDAVEFGNRCHSPSPLQARLAARCATLPSHAHSCLPCAHRPERGLLPIMILTCPDCGTQYVVKDDAIPPEGRQVRCAACKHSWHQDPEPQTEMARGEAQASAVPEKPGGTEALGAADENIAFEDQQEA